MLLTVRAAVLLVIVPALAVVPAMVLVVVPALAVIPAMVLVVVPALMVVVPALVPAVLLALTLAVIPAVVRRSAPTEAAVVGETDASTEGGQPHDRCGYDRYPLKLAHHSTLPYLGTKP
ncbi:hypothetical protein [Streptomyces sp. HUAS TT7]|uniref:hypothetical protein n=1 Tax=Streptomyces sp. HUAS TT7 TaxID=3447507 RepID=UPI003F65FC4D